jgi:hypothetical protein
MHTKKMRLDFVILVKSFLDFTQMFFLPSKSRNFQGEILMQLFELPFTAQRNNFEIFTKKA